MESKYYLPKVRPYKSSQVQMLEKRNTAEGVAMSVREAAFRREDTVNKYNSFVAESKAFLLEEALFGLFKKSLPEGVQESYLNYGRSLISNFIAEEGANSLLKSFGTKSYYLADLSYTINKTHKSIIEGCDLNDCNSFIIKGSGMSKFYDSLDKMSTEKMSETIASRVAEAEKEFIEANVQDRAKMEELAQQTKDKVDSYVNKDAETTKAVRESHSMIYKQNVNDLRRRPKGLLECIVSRTGQSAVKNADLKDSFVTEGGKLNTNKVIDVAEVTYTFLEMVNTANIKNLDTKYIEGLLAGI